MAKNKSVARARARTKGPVGLKDLVGLLPLPKGEDSVSIQRKMRDGQPPELLIAGWKLIKTNNAWCWQEPKTRARYRLEDALALVRSLRAPHVAKGSRRG
jgi:hypothetical protein